jgi:hypothetical protein
MKRLLQITVAIAALVPIAAGLAGILIGPGMAEQGVPDITASLSLDSHFRYLSGLLLGIGLSFWSTIPDIEHKTERFVLLTAIVFIGGLGREVSIMAVGMPSPGMLFGLGMELVVTPLLALFQYRIARDLISRAST